MPAWTVQNSPITILNRTMSVNKKYSHSQSYHEAHLIMIGLRNLVLVWNHSEDIRMAKSIPQVKKIAKSISKLLPI